MSESRTLDELREHLFQTLDALRDEKNPMAVERAHAIAEVAQTVINTAKVEVDYLRVNNGGDSAFISAVGRGAGIDGERSGLWVEMARIIREVRPEFAFVENSPMLTSRGLDRVLGDLAEMGFDARWGVLGADDVGAPHKRERIWIVAHANSKHGRCGTAGKDRKEAGDGGTNVANPARFQQGRQEQRAEWQRVRSCSESAALSNAAGEGRTQSKRAGETLPGTGAREFAGQDGSGRNPWFPEPDVGRVADGVAARVDRLRCLGNGQVPRVAASAWRILTHNAQPTGRR